MSVEDDDLQFARSVGTRAAAVLRAGWGNAGTIALKGNHPADLVTEYDMASEAVIVGEIRARFPADRILAEESGASGEYGGRRWFIDPLDGTTNFAHGLPVFAVSIGLEIEGVLVLGVVHAPALDLEFYAAHGSGAWLRRGASTARLAVSTTQRLDRALLGTGFPLSSRASPESFRAFESMYRRTQGVRRMGAAALDLAFVAAGWLDGYWEGPLKPWDLAAGAVLVSEAGGRVSDFAGAPFAPDDGHILASNGHLHEPLRAALFDL